MLAKPADCGASISITLLNPDTRQRIATSRHLSRAC